ncbi:hypothetical protein [Blattabacterium cuenoti]|uniref:hypothetical protein n=1 Tax=Blattabacterium cuenoti TaxID=1653831 RepID=UPI00163BCFB6|nr:hypothetical protein [Blattabacterium cuenoti]
MNDLNIDYISKAPLNTEIIDKIYLEKLTGKNIFCTICILDKISQKIDNLIKSDLYKKLEDFNFTDRDNGSLEEIFENKEQIELSKFYENLPKPTSIAIQYLLDNKVKI